MKYSELARILRDNIGSGTYIENGKLPTENQLMKQYQVSRYCVRNAIGILVELGEVYPVQGSGMFIRENKKEGCISVRNTKGLTDEFPNQALETEVIQIQQVEAGEKLAKHMKCLADTPLYYLVRIRKIDGKPICVEQTYYNKQIIPLIDEKIAQGSMYKYIHELGLNVGFADKVLYCEKLTKEMSVYLQLEEGDPVFIVEDDAYLANGCMFNTSKVYYHYERTKFFDLAEMK